MLIQGQVGPTSTQSVQPGTTPPVRLGQFGDVIVSELHGRYYEQTFRRNMFSGAIASATGATATALGNIGGSAYVGLLLWNPVSSPVNLVLQKVNYTLPIAPAAATVVSIGTGTAISPPTTVTTAITPRNNYVTGPAPVGQLYSAVTFSSAGTSSTLPSHTLGFVGTQAATGEGQQTPGMIDLEGSIVLPPSGFACFYLSTVANTNGFFGSFAWEEVPV